MGGGGGIGKAIGGAVKNVTKAPGGFIKSASKGDIGGMIKNTGVGVGMQFGADLLGLKGGKQSGPNIPNIPKPIAPEFQATGVDPKTGVLKPNFTYQQNNQGIEALRAQAGGTSPWAGQLQTDINTQTARNINGINAQQQTGQAEAQSALARTGGLGRGAQERLGKQGTFQAMMQRQQAKRLGLEQGLEANTAVAQERMKTTQALPGMEAQAMQGQQFNVENQLAAKRMQDQLNQQKFGIQMKEFGTEQSANALANSGSKGLLGDIWGGVSGMMG